MWCWAVVLYLLTLSKRKNVKYHCLALSFFTPPIPLTCHILCQYERCTHSEIILTAAKRRVRVTGLLASNKSSFILIVFVFWHNEEYFSKCFVLAFTHQNETPAFSVPFSTHSCWWNIGTPATAALTHICQSAGFRPACDVTISQRPFQCRVIFPQFQPLFYHIIFLFYGKYDYRSNILHFFYLQRYLVKRRRKKRKPETRSTDEFPVRFSFFLGATIFFFFFRSWKKGHTAVFCVTLQR